MLHSEWSLGAVRGTNQTGELTRVVEGLLWLLQVCSNTATIESNRVRIRHTKPQETAGSYAPCPTGPVCGRVHGSVAQLVGVPIGLC